MEQCILASSAAAQQHQQALSLCPADLSSILDDPPSSQDEALYNLQYGKVGDEDLDLYEQFVALEEELAALESREEHVRKEMAALRCEERCAQFLLLLASVAKARAAAAAAAPLVVAHMDELVGDHAVVTFPETGRTLYVGVQEAVDRALLVPGASVLLPAFTCHAVVGVLPADDAGGGEAERFVLAEEERPRVTYDDVVGLEEQVREVREAVELPLAHPELLARVGVDPPRGVLMCGPPGTGKTMLARAVAHHTSACFLRLNGTDLVSKFLGEGPRVVRDVFRVARARAPSIVFIDEADAVATARSDDAETGADREAQRVLVELLAQMDGFDKGGHDGVRVIMATNRAEDLDPALLRPGRLDRKVEFTVPDTRPKRLALFRACAAGMSLDGDVDLDELATRRERMSAAEIGAVCFEAGMRAVRGDRWVVTREDLEQGYRAVVDKTAERGNAYHELSFYS